MVSSQLAFVVLVLLVALERGLELLVARGHERVLRAEGAIEVGARHYPVMVLLHSLWLVAAPVEVLLFDRPLRPGWAVVLLLLVAATQATRYWVIATLKERWTTRVWVLPDAPLVTTGPYRWLRHPNYVAVAVEIFALPLVHGAWATAVGFGVANGVLLWHRIRLEDRALADLR